MTKHILVRRFRKVNLILCYIEPDVSCIRFWFIKIFRNFLRLVNEISLKWSYKVMNIRLKCACMFLL